MPSAATPAIRHSSRSGLPTLDDLSPEGLWPAGRSPVFAQAGFTLVEISIVLVIIGLIVGGVMVGRDLLEVAEVRGQLRQIEQLTTAANAFRLKYRYLPGDIPNAVAYGLGTNAAWHNGNADGRVNAECTQVMHNWAAGAGWRNIEADNFYYHLSGAQLLQGGAFSTGYQGEGHAALYTQDTLDQRFLRPRMSTTNKAWIFPSHFSGPNVSVYCDSSDVRAGGNGLMIATLNPDTMGQFRGAILPRFMKMMDDKIDDGRPRSGKLGNARLSNKFIFIHVVDDTNGAGACSQTTSNEYVNNDDYAHNGFLGCQPAFLDRF